MEEQWKTIGDFPNYEISNKGRVRNKNTMHIRKIMNECTCPVVSLNDGSKVITRTINSLMMQVWGFPLSPYKNKSKYNEYGDALEDINKLIKEFGMNVDEILSNRDDYEVIIYDITDNSIKDIQSIDRFEKMFNGDNQMFLDYLKLISTGKINGASNELWGIRKK